MPEPSQLDEKHVLLWESWASADKEVAKQADAQFVEMGAEADPILDHAIATQHPRKYDAYQAYLRRDKDTIESKLDPWLKNPETAQDIWAASKQIREPIPALWPYLVGSLQDAEFSATLRCMEAIQHQIAWAQVTETDFADTAKALIGPLLRIIPSERIQEAKAASIIIFMIPIKNTLFIDPLEDRILKGFEKREFELHYILRALMAQELPDKQKLGICQRVMDKGLHHYDRISAIRMGLAAEGGNDADFLAAIGQLQGEFENSPSKDIQKLVNDIDKLLNPKAFVHSKGFPEEYKDWYREMEAPDETGSSLLNRSTIARAKMQRNHDDSHAHKIVDALSGKLKSQEYQHLLYAVSCLLKNTGNDLLRNWLKKECQRTDLKKPQKESIMLWFAGMSEVKYLARISAKEERPLHFTLEALSENPSEEDVEALIEIGKKSESDRLLVVFALEKAGSPRAVPFLMDLVRRDYTSKRQEERDWRYYSILTLGTLGDTSVVTELCDLMGSRGPDPCTIEALANLGDPRALNTAIENAQKIFSMKNYTSGWLVGTKAPVYNALLLAKKTNCLEKEEVRSWITKLNEPNNRKLLYQKERDLMDEILKG